MNSIQYSFFNMIDAFVFGRVALSEGGWVILLTSEGLYIERDGPQLVPALAGGVQVEASAA